MVAAWYAGGEIYISIIPLNGNQDCEEDEEEEAGTLNFVSSPQKIFFLLRPSIHSSDILIFSGYFLAPAGKKALVFAARSVWHKAIPFHLFLFLQQESHIVCCEGNKTQEKATMPEFPSTIVSIFFSGRRTSTPPAPFSMVKKTNSRQ